MFISFRHILATALTAFKSLANRETEFVQK